MSNHIIHSQKMMLTVDSQQDWELVQAHINDFCTKDLPEIFNAIFDQAANFETIRIEKLNLNLGNIPLNKLTEVLKEQISIQLLNQLKEYKLTRFNDTLDLSRKPANLFKNAGQFSKTSLRNKHSVSNPVEAPLNDYEALVFYCETGAKPWWLSQEITFTPATMLLNLFRDDRLIFSHFVSAIKDNHSVYLRLKQLISKSSFFYDYQLFNIKNEFLKHFISVVNAFIYNLILDIWIENLVLIKREIIESNFETWLLNMVKHHLTLGEEVSSIVKAFASKFAKSKKQNLQLITLAEFLDTIKPNREILSKITPVIIEKTISQKSIVKKPLTSSIIIENAGLVVLHPFIKPLFKQLKLVNDNGFLDELAQQKAIVYLHYLVYNEVPKDESLLLLNKILCGAAPESVIELNQIEFSAEDLVESEELKKVIIDHWGALGSTSPAGLTDTFLLRNGSLNFKDGNWNLDVEKKGLDILLNQLPWGLTMIKLQWNKYLIQVNWSI